MAHEGVLSRVKTTDTIPLVLVEEVIGQYLDVYVSLFTIKRAQLMQQADS